MERGSGTLDVEATAREMETYLSAGIPPSKAPFVRMREPRTASYSPQATKCAMAGISFGVYW